ncbi:hypothetical protein WOLCODRAFT_18323 [Wolfiporia cocos MD-104 SS10]|uniref:Uncharacterized protein n=1 Tax=Wolfiporia cocos (strain MD-104) TaxID=742152 RepID=A0A2H3JMI8_WOLCO|nr:hypothetical protein WOLCODRAFT_18323 [Wolfiporia cocos MD-104 SS10]
MSRLDTEFHEMQHIDPDTDKVTIADVQYFAVRDQEEENPFLSRQATTVDLDEEVRTVPGPSNRKPRTWGRLRLSLESAKWKAFFHVRRNMVLYAGILVIGTICIGFGMGWTMRLDAFWAVQILDLWAADQPVASMTIDWFVDYQCLQEELYVDVNIYFDQNVLLSGENGLLSNNKIPPIFFLNGTVNWRRTGHNNELYGGGSSGQLYQASLAFAVEDMQNTSIPFSPSYSQGIVVGFNAELDDDTSGYATGGILVKNIVVTIGQVIRLYAIVIVLAIWMVTLVFFLGCLLTVGMGKKVKADYFVLPVTALFTFATLRGTLPGAPSTFGAEIDFVAVLPCLIPLTISGTNVVYGFRSK